MYHREACQGKNRYNAKKAFSDNSGLRCATCECEVPRLICDIQSNTVLPVRSALSAMEGNPGILRPARMVTVLAGVRQHWSFYISFGRSVR
jgi:hypothetical protein